MNKNTYGKPPPKTRAEMEHNIALLFEDTLKKFESGDKSLIGSVMAFTAPKLKKIEFCPNGRIEISTIDESIRLQSNMMKWMGDMK